MDFGPRWWPLAIEHPEQQRLWHSKARFNVTAASRRGGKTEIEKRKLVLACLNPPSVNRPTFAACAPTRDQAKRIFWDDLKALTPRSMLAGVSETDLSIYFKNGAQLWTVGFDKPQRIEGPPLDGAVVDEMAECKPRAWESTLRPALSTLGRPPGWCDFIGRPRGRGFFYKLWSEARTKPGWAAFHWTADGLLSPEELESAKRDLDPLTYAQEYEAQFVTFEGRAYYAYDSIKNVRSLSYAPARPLILTFDFNVSPGSACVLQEQLVDGDRQLATCAIGEVHVPRGSNTPIVCERLAHDWAHHKGPVEVYGDATGGAHKTASTSGSDWDIIRAHFRTSFPQAQFFVPRANPLQRVRVNAVNGRCCNAMGERRFFVDPTKAPQLALDMEGMALLEGGSGELDETDLLRGHWSSSVGYYIALRYPLASREMQVSSFVSR